MVHLKSQMECALLTLCFIARVTDLHFREKLLQKYYKPPTADLVYPLLSVHLMLLCTCLSSGGRTCSDLYSREQLVFAPIMIMTSSSFSFWNQMTKCFGSVFISSHSAQFQILKAALVQSTKHHMILLGDTEFTFE